MKNMDLSKVQIETDRLQLIPVANEHVEQIFLEYRLPLTKYMNHTSTGSLEELKERHKKWQRQLKEGARLFMAVHLKESNEFLGCFALDHIEEKTPEMGGWLKKSAHGFGYGREAATALKQWADENIKYNYILWPCAIANISSCKLAESLGGKVHREYDKEMASGDVWPARDYWIPRNGEK